MKPLKEQLPENYMGSPETCAIEDAIEPEVIGVWDAQGSLMDQLFVDTATWGLDLWERDYGLETDKSKPDDFRRSRIISKIRSQGTATKEMIKNAAESFSGGETEIIEYPSEHRFEVKFSGTVGTPPNMDDLTEAIEDIKPAHLAYSYVYIFVLYKELKPYTHEQLSKYTHKEIRNGAMKQ